MKRVELRIDGMSCDHCTARVRKALEATEGVDVVTVSLDPGGAVVEGPSLDPQALMAVVERAGYDARPAG